MFTRPYRPQANGKVERSTGRGPLNGPMPIPTTVKPPVRACIRSGCITTITTDPIAHWAAQLPRKSFATSRDITSSLGVRTVSPACLWSCSASARSPPVRHQAGSSPPGTRRSGRCRWARTASSRSSTSPTRRASTLPPRRIHSRGRTRSSGTAGTRRRSPAPCSCRASRAGSWRGPTHARPRCPTPGASCPCGTSTSPPRGSSLPRGRYRRTRPVSSTPSTGPSRAGCGCGTRAPSCRVAGWRSPAVTWSAPPVSSRNATGGPPCSPPPSAVHRTRSSQSTSRSAR